MTNLRGRETRLSIFMTTVAIVEDNASVAASLRRIVESTPGFACIGTWRSGEEALLKVPGFRPAVVLMDIHMPGISGIEATAQLKKDIPELLVIMVTVYRDHDKIFDALKAGACGYLLKRSKPEEVRRALMEVRDGGAPMSAEIARRVVQAFHRPAREEAAQLSKREVEILEWLTQGLANKEIADRLTLSVETVRAHLKRIYDKLHVHSRTEAAMKFREMGR